MAQKLRPAESRSPAARPPAGRKRALAGLASLDGRPDRPRSVDLRRPARGTKARAVRAECRSCGIGLSSAAARGARRGVRHRDPGSLASSRPAKDHPPKPLRAAASAAPFVTSCRPAGGPSAPMPPRSSSPRDAPSGTGSNPPQDRCFSRPSVESCRFRTPPRSGCRSACACSRRLVGGARGCAAPAGA